MPTFEYVSRYPHPRSEVFAWHTRPGAFVRLTPPGMATLVEGVDDLSVGTEVVLRVSHPIVAGLLPDVGRKRKGPVGFPWRVRHTELVPGERFVDEQVSGPFQRWIHEHHFAEGPGNATIVTDRVHWELRTLPARIANPLVEMQLSGLFGFRERQLRADLALHARLGATPARSSSRARPGWSGRSCALSSPPAGTRCVASCAAPPPGRTPSRGTRPRASCRAMPSRAPTPS